MEPWQGGDRRTRIFRGAERLGGWGVLDQAILAISGLAISIVVARSGGPSELGSFVLVQSAALFLTGIVKAAVGDPLIVESNGPLSRKIGAVGPIVFAHLTFAMLMGVVAYTALSVGEGGAGVRELWIMVALIPVAALYEFSRSVRLALMGERSLFLGDALVVGTRLAILLTWYLGFQGSLLGMMAWAGGSAASLLTIRPFLPPRVWDFRALPKLWKLGRWFVGESFIFALGAYGFWFIAAPRAGIEIAGQLRGVQQLFAPLQALMVGLSTVMLARLVRTGGRLSGDARILGYVQVASNAAWAGLVVIMGSAGVTLIFGEGFAVHRSTLALFGLATTIGAAYGVVAMQLRAAKLGSALLRARLAATSTSLIGVALLGFSLETIVIVMIAAQSVGLLSSWAFVRQNRPRPDAIEKITR